MCVYRRTINTCSKIIQTKLSDWWSNILKSFKLVKKEYEIRWCDASLGFFLNSNC